MKHRPGRNVYISLRRGQGGHKTEASVCVCVCVCARWSLLERLTAGRPKKWGCNNNDNHSNNHSHNRNNNNERVGPLLAIYFGNIFRFSFVRFSPLLGRRNTLHVAGRCACVHLPTSCSSRFFSEWADGLNIPHYLRHYITVNCGHQLGSRRSPGGSNEPIWIFICIFLFPPHSPLVPMFVDIATIEKWRRGKTGRPCGSPFRPWEPSRLLFESVNTLALDSALNQRLRTLWFIQMRHRAGHLLTKVCTAQRERLLARFITFKEAEQIRP